jgi:hypothetical protein
MELGKVFFSMSILILTPTQNTSFRLFFHKLRKGKVCYNYYAILRTNIFDWSFGIRTYFLYYRDTLRKKENNIRTKNIYLSEMG